MAGVSKHYGCYYIHIDKWYLDHQIFEVLSGLIRDQIGRREGSASAAQLERALAIAKSGTGSWRKRLLRLWAAYKMTNLEALSLFEWSVKPGGRKKSDCLFRRTATSARLFTPKEVAVKSTVPHFFLAGTRWNPAPQPTPLIEEAPRPFDTGDWQIGAVNAVPEGDNIGQNPVILRGAIVRPRGQERQVVPPAFRPLTLRINRANNTF